MVLYELHASGGAKVTAYCPRLAQAAASNWNPQAARGIRPGMPLAEATALALRMQAPAANEIVRRATPVSSLIDPEEQLHLEQADPLADRRAIEALADDCQRFAPSVGIDDAGPADSLLLDVTGLGPLCGGEIALARRIVADFHRRRLSVRVALADTPGAAWAVAHFAPLECTAAAPHAASILTALSQPLLIRVGETASALAALPPAALRLADDACRLLGELGIKRIEQLAALPRETLLSRFGPLVLLRLDQASGTAAEAIVARAVPAEWTFEWLLEHPTGRREMIEWTVEQLVARACQTLARERRGVLRLACRFEPERGTPVEFVVGLYRPSASERHVGELVRLKLEAVRFREPLVAIRLQVLALDRLEFQQQEFFAGLEGQHRDAPRELAALVDRLSNRLGSHAVVRPWLLAGAQPEFACQYQPLASLPARRGKRGSRPLKKPKNPSLPSPLAGDGPGVRGQTQDVNASTQPGDRPLWLEPQPQALAVISVAPDGPPVKFRLSGEDHRIQRTWGPERIETGWWRTRCIRRDYYQVETQTGDRYWLYRELNSGQWFLQGTF